MLGEDLVVRHYISKEAAHSDSNGKLRFTLLSIIIGLSMQALESLDWIAVSYMRDDQCEDIPASAAGAA